jgi:hypothetical protein
MINLTDLVANWETSGTWKIAPEGQEHFPVGARVSIGFNCAAGDDFKAGDDAKGIHNFGITNGHSKSLSSVDGVAYVGAGCRWFTLDAARLHWEHHTQDRAMTLCLLPAMYAMAKHLGLKTS